jgi:hypothetical protein
MKWLYHSRMGRRAVQESVKLTACDKLVSSDRGRYIAMVAEDTAAVRQACQLSECVFC